MWQLFFILLGIAIVGIIVHKIVSADTADHKKENASFTSGKRPAASGRRFDDRTVRSLQKSLAPPARYARKTYRKWKSGEVTPPLRPFADFFCICPR